ncbi:MAG: hypothetical protein QXE82_03045 [Candidatus Nitrosotenuis sp.]
MDHSTARRLLKIILTKDGEIFLAANSAVGIDSANPRLEPIKAISSVSTRDETILSPTLRSIVSISLIIVNELPESLNIDNGLNPRWAELATMISSNTSHAY